MDGLLASPAVRFHRFDLVEGVFKACDGSERAVIDDDGVLDVGLGVLWEPRKPKAA